MRRFQQYIDDVMGGNIVVGELTRLAVKRHLNDMKAGVWQFDDARAAKVIKIAEIMRHWRGSKANTRIVLEPHQVFRLASMWGWVDEQGLRRFRRSNYFVARKNAKTTEAAINAIIHLLLDREQGSQVYSFATKEDQARIALHDMGMIIRSTPELAPKFKSFKLKEYINRVVYHDTNSFATALGSDSQRQDGTDPTWGICDEYHAHPTDEMYNVIESGMGARRQPMIEVITTAGFNKNHPAYSNTRDQAIKILRGTLTDDRALHMIYEMDDLDDWQDEANWVKANPNLGKSFQSEYLKIRFTKARNEGGATEVDFKTKNLNMWVDSVYAWVSDELWKSLASDDSMMLGDCYAGLDLAPVRDFSAMVLYFPETGYIKPYIWTNNDSIYGKYGNIIADVHKWVQGDHLTVCEGNTTDYDQVLEDIKRVHDRYTIKGLAYDRAYASNLIYQLSDYGIKCSEFSQTITNMTYPTEMTEKLIKEKRIRHDGNPVMRWMISNVNAVIGKNDTVKLSKDKSAGKIDAAVAMVMAVGEHLTQLMNSTPTGGAMFIDWND